MNEKESLVGKKIGKYLTIIEKPFYETRGNNNNIYRYVKVRCICGKEKLIKFHFSTKKEYNRSCGCLMVEKTIKRSTTHGDHDKKLYFVWRSIKNRCYNVNSKNYVYYGLKGVKMCDEWRYNYLKFKDWALKNGYDEGLETHRINSDGDYKPNNCIFITGSENARLAGMQGGINRKKIKEKFDSLKEEVKKLNQENLNLKLELEIYKILNISIKFMCN